ncbi:hypothetical protein GFD17_02695 [Bifidobacterium sp. SMB2]|uniref:MobA/VirD2-like nuclease domain-containing protein n=1 Tax=Bifidobacterium saimiriisciurei TaxID=2661627 RepID=A0ABX0CFA0_9BIFI|nr:MULTISPECIES: hypothetical protein [Bifidobacterium]NEG95678.1 hypothetical protein [Bifidobacterium sp. SMB2]NEH11105.1 hypothetical protein [Bifidobacterium saimiriisciurei]
MSYTSVRPVRNMPALLQYLLYGSKGSEKYKRHHAEHTDRAAFILNDAGSIRAFRSESDRLLRKHGRDVAAYSYVVSFAPDELDVHNKDDLRRCGELAYELGKTMHPDSESLVIVHDDGEGGCAHAHLIVLNHDHRTGHALSKYRNAKSLHAINDKTMRNFGMNAMDGRDSWQVRRERFKEGSFDRVLGDRLMQAAQAADSFGEYVKKCDAVGIEVSVNPDDGHGIAYRMRFDDGRRVRKRRRRASSLAKDFAFDELTARFAAKDDNKEQEKEETMTTQPTVFVGKSKNVSSRDSGNVRPEVFVASRMADDDDDGTPILEVSRRWLEETYDDLIAARNKTCREQMRVLADDAVMKRLQKHRTDEDLLRQDLEDANVRMEWARNRFRMLRASQPEKVQGHDAVVWMLDLLVDNSLQRRDWFVLAVTMLLREQYAQHIIRVNRQIRTRHDAEVYEARAGMWSAEKRAKAAREALDQAMADTLVRRNGSGKSVLRIAPVFTEGTPRDDEPQF